MGKFQKGVKYDALLVSGLTSKDINPRTKKYYPAWTGSSGYMTVEQQVQHLKKGFGENKNVVGFWHADSIDTIISFLKENKKENGTLIPVFLFSAGCKYVDDLIPYVDKQKFFIVEPYVTPNLKSSANKAVNAGVPPTSFYAASYEAAGLNVVTGHSSTPYKKGDIAHWDSLKNVGALKKDVTPTVLGPNQTPVKTSETPTPPPPPINLVIGDFIAAQFAIATQNQVKLIPELAGDTIKNITALITAVRKAKTDPLVKKIIVSIGSADLWSATKNAGVDHRDELTTYIRRTYPNAELYILHGSYGWSTTGLDLRSNDTCNDDCWSKKIDAYILYFTSKKYSSIGKKTKLDKLPQKGDQLFNSFNDDLIRYKIPANTVQGPATVQGNAVNTGGSVSNVQGGSVSNAQGAVVPSQPVSKGELSNSGKEKSQDPQRNQLTSNKIVNLFPATIVPPPIVIPIPQEQKVKSEFINTFGYLPFIWYNAYQIDIENVDFFSITYEGILPVIKFSFRDTIGLIRDAGTPLDNTKLGVFLSPRSDRLRPVHIQFKITSFNNSNNIMSIVGSIDVDALYFQNYKSYNDVTSNFALQAIAKEIGLGFNTNIVETSDRMNWMNTGAKNHEFMQEIIDHAYISDESFVAGNLDLYYNMNFIDVQKELIRNLDEELGPLSDGVTEAMKEQVNSTNAPLFLTSDEALRGSSLFFSSWKLINRATSTSLNNGYYDDYIFFDSSNKKAHNFDLHSMNAGADKSIALKGNSSGDEFYQSNKNFVYGGKVVDDNTFINYSFADTHNRRNILEAEKIAAVIELPFPNFNLYTFQKIRIILSHNATTLANPSVNSRYSGDWLVADIKFVFFDRYFRQVVTLVKRELSLTDEEVRSGISVKPPAPAGRGKNINPVFIPTTTFETGPIGNSVSNVAVNTPAPGPPPAVGSIARKVFIAAGHGAKSAGGTDNGASGNGFIEAELNIELRNLISNELGKLGITAIKDPDAYALREQMGYFKGKYSPDDIMVDIHWNANTDKPNKPPAEGTEVFVPDDASNFENSLAKALVDSIASFGFKIRGSNGIRIPSQSQHKTLGWMTQNAETVLIEVCFISNPNEMKLYQSKKQEIAASLANVISNFARKGGGATKTPVAPSTGKPVVADKAKSVPDSAKIASFGQVSSIVPLAGRPFLDMLAYTEGTAGRSQNGYDIMYTGRKIPNWNENYKLGHPNIVIDGGRISSSAAGRYQFLSDVWKEYAGRRPFDKKNQDEVGWSLIVIKRSIKQTLIQDAFNVAKKQIAAGKIAVSSNESFLKFLDIADKEWASLPNRYGISYYSGQGGKYSAADVYAIFVEAVKRY